MTKILMVVTSHGDIHGEPVTGVWLSEFTEPYQVFVDAGIDVTVASPRGGPTPIDPRGYPSRETIAEVRDALERLNRTRSLAKMKVEEFDGIFMPGGHGPMFDLATDHTIKTLIASFWMAGKPVGAVCHGPATLLDVRLPNSETLLARRRVTGFTKAEDAVDPLFAVMPFSLQERMTAEGAIFIAEPPKAVHVETDGLLVTGQNPASASATAEAFLKALQKSHGAV